MTDRPILFSAPMIRALLDGRKTQTRRVLKRHPLHKPEPHVITFANGKLICRWHSGIRHEISAPYVPGDRLWVREAWKSCSQMDGIPPRDMSPGEPRLFVADGSLHEPACLMITPGRHRQAMHMPRWASRLTLVVTDVRVQRLQDISGADAIAEGIEDISDPRMQSFPAWKDYLGSADYFMAPQNSFRTLWDSINAERGFGWDANPWVVALTFAVHRCNIDMMEA